MNHHTLQVLGFYDLLQLIAGYAQSENGMRAVEALRPMTVLADIRGQRGLAEDMLRLAESSSSLPSLHVENLNEILVRVQPSEAVLAGDELVAIRSMLTSVGEVVEFFGAPETAGLAHLQTLVEKLDPCRSIADVLWRGLDADGTVLDSASPDLRDIRREIGGMERRIQKQLESLVKDPVLKDVLQDQFVTQRNGRFVMPVKRDARGALPGLIHDMSGTGQTVFIEPAAIVPMGNEMATLKLRERDEVRRILRLFSAKVRDKCEAIFENQAIMAKLDMAAAIARWAAEWSCVMPSFGGMLVLHEARHPLLLQHLREEGKGRKAVPLNLELPRGSNVLAITGSNTGGKTVALKTVGLLALCAQSGLPVPVDSDSLFPVFEHVLADIGDEQSMEANLSTFSAHVKGIAEIMKQVQTGRSLVLLDELGSGTDPLEGGALACGILNQLAEAKATVIATTHLGMVKNYVHSRKDMTNAAVRFNVETLMPEYVLEIGRPGASHAMLIAQKIGMPQKVMEVAQGMLSGDEVRLEDMLAKMEHQQRSLDEKNRHAEELKQQWTKRLEEVTKRQEELRQERKNLMNEAYQRAESMVDNTRRDLENMVRRIRETAKAQEGKKGADGSKENPLGKVIQEAREKFKEQEQKIAIGKGQTAAKKPAPLPARQLVEGKKIWVEKLQAHGRVTRVDPNGKSAIIDVNGISFTMKAAELSLSKEPDDGKTQKQPVTGGYSVPRVANTTHEINCIGMTVDEAIDQLQPYFSDCVLAGLDEVRVVHGFGTGRLRQGIHNWLRTQKYVDNFALGRDFEDSGGAGVTLVRLKK